MECWYSILIVGAETPTDLEPPAMQDQAAMQLQAQSGWGQWPTCAAALGLT